MFSLTEHQLKQHLETFILEISLHIHVCHTYIKYKYN